MGDELVECHSGYSYPERPMALNWLGQHLEITGIVAEWRSPQGKQFRVRTWDGQVFDLLYSEMYDHWRIVPV